MKGTHGTTQDRVESITNDGFRFNTTGDGRRKGSGAYFWDYESEDYRSDALLLAKIFWSNIERVKRDGRHANNKLAIADVTFDENMILLDTLLKEYYEILMEMLKESESKYVIDDSDPKSINFEELGGVYDNFVTETEKVWNKTIHAFRVQVNVVGRGYPWRYIIQPPSCLVVKTPDEVIRKLEFVDTSNL